MINVRCQYECNGCGLVNDRKEGKWHHYSLNCETLMNYKHFIESLTCLGCGTGIVVNNLRRADIMKKESNSGISFFQRYLTVTCQTSIWGSCR